MFLDHLIAWVAYLHILYFLLFLICWIYVLNVTECDVISWVLKCPSKCSILYCFCPVGAMALLKAHGELALVGKILIWIWLMTDPLEALSAWGALLQPNDGRLKHRLLFWHVQIVTGNDLCQFIGTKRKKLLL